MLQELSILALASICLIGALFGFFLIITNKIPKDKFVKIFFWTMEAILFGSATLCFVSLLS